jgi:hypothetical protein
MRHEPDPSPINLARRRDVRRPRHHRQIPLHHTVIVIAHGGWQVRTGNADQGKMSIVGGLLLGLAVVIADALFQAGGMPTIVIGG